MAGRTYTPNLHIPLLQGTDHVSAETFNLPIENSQRTILKIKKNTSIPSKYPRNFAKIKKNPL